MAAEPACPTGTHRPGARQWTRRMFDAGLARARMAAGARWTERRPGRDARVPRGAGQGRRSPHHEPAGPRHRRPVDHRLRHRRADPRLRDADSAWRAHRLPRHERARRRQRPRVAEHARGARRRPFRRQRPEGVDVGRQLRRLLLPLLPNGSRRRPKHKGISDPAGRHGHARASPCARWRRSCIPSAPTSTRCSSTTCGYRPATSSAQLNDGWAMANGSLAHERGMVWLSAVMELEACARRAARRGAGAARRACRPPSGRSPPIGS